MNTRGMLFLGGALARRLALVLIIAGILSGHSAAKAQSYTTLYSFQCGPGDGAFPSSSLALDGAGNLYGDTEGGGLYGFGTVFELSPDGAETLLHNFEGPPTDGAYPIYTGIARDSDGNLYGTTPNGGTSDLGTVFKVTSAGTESVLVNFTYTTTFSVLPNAGLILDSAANLYGTTYGDSKSDEGSVFEVSSSGQLTTLYLFGAPYFGSHPIGGLVRDSAGNLYGTTLEGGGNNFGTVFKVTPTGGETVLHSFSGRDGEQPYDGLALDKSGNLYGTTFAGGISDDGTVFRVSTTKGVSTILHKFTGSPDGASPTASVTLSPTGGIYGVTLYGGTGTCNDGVSVGCGTIFHISPQGKESVLHSFTGTPDGSWPQTTLIRDANGNLYGTTGAGGAYGCGTVFKYTP